jgi:hypothetical protein
MATGPAVLNPKEQVAIAMIAMRMMTAQTCQDAIKDHNGAKRDVARVFHAFQGSDSADKFSMLSTIYAAVMLGAMPAEGQKREKTRPVRQDEMAAALGLQQRSSYTRRLSPIANAVADWNVEARQKHAEKLYSVAQAKYEKHVAGCKICSSEHLCNLGKLLKRQIRAPRTERTLKQAMEIVHRERRFARPNKMTFNLTGDQKLGERSENWIVVDTQTGKPASGQFMSPLRAALECEKLQSKSGRMYQVEAVALDSKCYHAPSIDQLASDPRTGHYWNPEFQAEGFGKIDKWIFDPRLLDPDDPAKPLGDVERMVMAAYQQMGLKDEFPAASGRPGKAAGILDVHQQKVADYLGISRKSVYNANCKWVKLGILRVAHSPEKQEDGSYKSGPQKIIYLPMRTLTEREAEVEAGRFQDRVREIVAREGARRRAGLERAAQLHRELLVAWTGKEHCLRAFWRELERRMVFDPAIDDYLIKRLIPIPSPTQ